RLLLGKTSGHQLTEETHHFFVFERPLIAFHHLAQHLSFALGAVELGGLRQALDRADLLSGVSTLGDQHLNLGVYLIDALAKLLDGGGFVGGWLLVHASRLEERKDAGPKYA